MKHISWILILSVILWSCAGKTDNNTLAAKKKELANLETQAGSLADKITKLKDEIALLDTSSVDKIEKLVALDTIKNTPFSSVVTMMGKIDVDANSVISSTMAGAVKRIYVKEGNYVRQGALLARVDNNVIDQNIAQVKQQLAFATDVYNKQKSLWDQKIGSEIQFLSAKNNKESLEANLRTLAQSNELYNIRAPFSGVVDMVAIKLGQLLAPGVPAFRIVNKEGISLKADIPESYIAKIKQGESVTIYFPDLKKEVKGTVRYLSQIVNPVNRTFTADITINGNKDGIKSAMVGILKVSDFSSKNTIAIPIKNLLKNAEGYFVYLAENKDGQLVATQVPIKTGAVNGESIQVTEGLKVGDMLITSGSQSINPGDLLKTSLN
jgi:RND family efflux transporter MFP subunit